MSAEFSYNFFSLSHFRPQEINEFQNLLEYLNEELAPAVSIFTVVNVSWASAGVMWIFNYDNVDKDTHPIIVVSVLNVSLWVLASIAPFVQVINTQSKQLFFSLSF